MNTQAREHAPTLPTSAAVLDAAQRVILGKPEQIRLCLACLLARGHLLIEDVPGVGKTTLAHALAHVLGLALQRVQFTSDLLPADVIGVSIFDREHAASSAFSAARSSPSCCSPTRSTARAPKAQSALLEAMEERQVSVDGTIDAAARAVLRRSRRRIRSEQLGTFPLPESQLDRFLMRVTWAIRTRAAERELLSGSERRELVNSLGTVLSADVLRALQQRVLEVHVAPALLDYVQALVAHTRSAAGLEPRPVAARRHRTCCARRAPGH